MTDIKIIEEISKLGLKTLPKEITEAIELALLRTKVKVDNLTVNDVINVVFEYYSLDPSPRYYKIRRREYVQARMFVFYIVRFRFHLPLEKVAKIFNKNHSTVIHAIKTVESITMYNDINREFVEIQTLLESKAKHNSINNEILIGV